MAAKTTYTCDLCRRDIDDKIKVNQYPQGWALSWCGPGNHRPQPGATLEPTRSWPESPIHLCQVCVQAVGTLRDILANKNQLMK